MTSMVIVESGNFFLLDLVYLNLYLYFYVYLLFCSCYCGRYGYDVASNYVG